ncbi:MAG: 3-oxoacyl-ACP synthase III [Variovorax sp.]
MRWSNVCIEAVASVVPDEKLTTTAIELRLAPLYTALRLEPGQIASLTGIHERRIWPAHSKMGDCAALAARQALDQSGIDADELGAVVYAGVCRDNLEPATACSVADAIGVHPGALVFDISNACLGVMNGIVELANRIELGQMRAGMVVSAESSREIIESTITRLNADPTPERYRLGVATMTGGSGAVAVVLTHADISGAEHRLCAAAAQNAVTHHRICRWGPSHGLLGETENIMNTDASAVLQHGVELGRRTWAKLLENTGWRCEDVDRVICHQVGSSHRREVLAMLGIDEAREFSTFESLGNIGTVSVPLTAARAAEAGFLRSGDRVALLGIGSGLNCLMLGIQW